MNHTYQARAIIRSHDTYLEKLLKPAATYSLPVATVASKSAYIAALENNHLSGVCIRMEFTSARSQHCYPPGFDLPAALKRVGKLHSNAFTDKPLPKRPPYRNTGALLTAPFEPVPESLT